MQQDKDVLKIKELASWPYPFALRWKEKWESKLQELATQNGTSFIEEVTILIRFEPTSNGFTGLEELDHLAFLEEEEYCKFANLPWYTQIKSLPKPIIALCIPVLLVGVALILYISFNPNPKGFLHYLAVFSFCFGTTLFHGQLSKMGPTFWKRIRREQFRLRYLDKNTSPKFTLFMKVMAKFVKWLAE